MLLTILILHTPIQTESVYVEPGVTLPAPAPPPKRKREMKQSPKIPQEEVQHGNYLKEDNPIFEILHIPFLWFACFGLNSPN